MSDVDAVSSAGKSVCSTTSASRLLVESLVLAAMLLASLAAAIGERNHVIPGGGYVSSLLLLTMSVWFARQFRVKMPILGQGAVSQFLCLAVPIASIVALAYYGMWPRSPEPTWMPGLLTGIHLIVVVPLAEELYFRGLLLDHLKRGFGVYPAVILCSLLFALLHLPSEGAVAAGLLSLVACFLVLRGGSLLLAVQAHMAWNGLTMVSRFDSDHLRWVYALATAAIIIAVWFGAWAYRSAVREKSGDL